MKGPSDLIQLGVLGASGRTGGLVIKSLCQFPNYQLAAALIAPDAPEIGKVCCSAESNHGREVLYSSQMSLAVSSCQVMIDFSSPESSLELLKACAEKGVAVLVATTGHNSAELSQIENYSRKIPILLSANTALGVFVLSELSKLAAKLLGPDFDIEILDIHHRAKKDAPSGTALALGHSIKQAAAFSEFDFSLSRDSSKGPAVRSNKEIGFSALRGGSVPGDHTVFFLGNSERIELTYRAEDRSVFARGALSLAQKLIKLKPGLYNMHDMYS